MSGPCPDRPRRPTWIPPGTPSGGPSCGTASSSRTPTRSRPAVAGRRCCSCTAGPRRCASGGGTSAPLAAAGLRGDRPRPARVRRVGGSPRTATTTSRRTRATCTRSSTTCSATSAAWRAAATSARGVIIDLGLRFPGFVERQVLFNGILPILPEAYAAAGIDPAPSPEVRAGGRLLRAPGPRRGRARGRARDARAAPALRRAVLRLALLGDAGRVLARGGGVHGRAVRGPGEAAGVVRQLRERARARSR